MPEAAGSPPEPPDQYAGAIDSCRSVLKWVLSSFGAIAAVFVAGVQLTSIGDLHGIRLTAAVAAFAVAFGAVFVVIILTIRVLAPSGGSYSDFESGAAFGALRKELARDPAPLRGKAGTAQELATVYERSLKDEIDAYEQCASDPTDALKKRAYEEATAKRKSLYPTLNAVTSYGVYLRVRELFDQTVLAIKILVPVVAIAAIVFAYAANPPKPATPAPVPTASETRFTGKIPLALDRTELNRIQHALSRRCHLPHHAYVVSATDKIETLLLVTPQNCPSVIVTVPSRSK